MTDFMKYKAETGNKQRPSGLIVCGIILIFYPGEFTRRRRDIGSLRYATARRYYGDRDRARLGGARRLTRQTQMIKIWAVIRLRHVNKPWRLKKDLNRL